MMPVNGELSVPPGFRFHPTGEELLYYYLRKKVSYEAIDLDVIKEVDLNKLEPWDLKEKCRIGTGPQNEWYFFSHKDKKYPTGTRTNRATTAGFWKATGRDKAIHHHLGPRRIGMRKTLVFYTGRAPHGQKTDWIMHEYRLDDHSTDHGQHQDLNSNITNHDSPDIQEGGWVVCRVFKKKNLNRLSPFQHGDHHHNSVQISDQEEHHYQFGMQDHDDISKQMGMMISSTSTNTRSSSACTLVLPLDPLDGDDDNPKHNNNNNNNNMVQQQRMQCPQFQYWSSGINNYHSSTSGRLTPTASTVQFDATMHLPQLLTSHDHSLIHPPSSTTFLPSPGSGAEAETEAANNNNDHNTGIYGSMVHHDINIDCSRNLLSLMSTGCGTCCASGLLIHPQAQSSLDKSSFAASGTTAADWSFLDKLLASHHHHHQDKSSHHPSPSSSLQPPLIHHHDHDVDVGPPSHKFPFQYQPTF